MIDKEVTVIPQETKTLHVKKLCSHFQTKPKQTSFIFPPPEEKNFVCNTIYAFIFVDFGSIIIETDLNLMVALKILCATA